MATKDWKAEYEKLKGQMEELRNQLTYERSWRENSQRRAEDTRDKFKELLIDVLGR